MIELLLTMAAFFGFALGDDVDVTNVQTLDTENKQIIRAIDTMELQGLNTLEAHNADEWFV